MRTAELKLFPGDGMSGTCAPEGIENRTKRMNAYTHFMGLILHLIIFIIDA